MKMSREVVFEVRGFPPIKNQATSMLSKKHGDAAKVKALLQATKEEMLMREFIPFAANDSLGLEVVLYAKGRGDATNYLGGIGDALEQKSRRGTLDHLGELATVFLYPNDRQIREIRYRQEPGNEARYTVRVWSR